MKYIFLSLLALAAITGFLVNQKPQAILQLANNNIPNNVVTLFKDWKKEYGMDYSPEVENIRLHIFYENLKKIEEENARQNEYQLGINQFTATTTEEFVHIYLGTFPRQDENIDEEDIEPYTVPSNAVDWRNQGIVGPVKNQGSCGSCWAFSATAVVQSHNAANKNVPNLSEQQLVDCTRGINHGCNGGWPDKALQWIVSHGQTTTSAYPYTGRDGTCKTSSGSYKIPKVGTGKGCPTLTSKLGQKPVSVCVDATNWSSYKSGIFSNCKSSINHAVFAVGYDGSGNWIIKNSWGTGWGQGGYITLKKDNTCGVCQELAWSN